MEKAFESFVKYQKEAEERFMQYQQELAKRETDLEDERRRQDKEHELRMLEMMGRMFGERNNYSQYDTNYPIPYDNYYKQ